MGKRTQPGLVKAECNLVATGEAYCHHSDGGNQNWCNLSTPPPRRRRRLHDPFCLPPHHPPMVPRGRRLLLLLLAMIRYRW
jgi:hypothetical protein